MRWTNSWGRGFNRSAGRAPGHCMLRWGQDVPSFPDAPFLAPALFLRCASDSFSLTKPNTPCTIERAFCFRIGGPSRQRRYAPMVFGFIPECRQASLRKQRSASPESSKSKRAGYRRVVRPASSFYRVVGPLDPLPFIGTPSDLRCFDLNGRFLSARNKSVWEPNRPGPSRKFMKTSGCI
jgi:hypothetical protein